MKTLSSKLASAWCRLTHGSPMWPIHGQYRCPTCFRAYPVTWEAAPEASRPVLVRPRAHSPVRLRHTSRALTRAS